MVRTAGQRHGETGVGRVRLPHGNRQTSLPDARDLPILAVATLAKTAHSFQHMPEAVVRRDGYPDIEVDLWAIVNGRIIIGEAKISNRLEPTKRKEAQRCAALKADG
ncbi:hypothetical protein [Streptomyces sp. PAM3C]|uniref:hypothetical protein n=1 Tax=Streptomyces sp. PAM3C TaxID=2847300 RepID=UPI001C1DDE77|nr:hypothetical protein [Streptomyces sp. PAM3C]MBU5947661.1 hypothetical protein [Streptomyces sp. PAM3C]